MKSSSPFAKYALGGWSLIGNFTAHTGSPFTLYDCTNGISVCPFAMFKTAVPSTPATAPKATATPNIYNYLDVSKQLIDTPWFNPKTGISDFGPFPSSMLGRNFFRGPGLWNLDFAIHKSFNFTETKRLQFRGEAFNVFNHPNLVANTGDNDVSSIDFVSASFAGRRQVQLGIRFDF